MFVSRYCFTKEDTQEHKQHVVKTNQDISLSLRTLKEDKTDDKTGCRNLKCELLRPNFSYTVIFIF